MKIVYLLFGMFHEVVLPEGVTEVTVELPETDDMPALDVHVFADKVELDEHAGDSPIASLDFKMSIKEWTKELDDCTAAKENKRANEILDGVIENIKDNNRFLRNKLDLAKIVADIVVPDTGSWDCDYTTTQHLVEAAHKKFEIEFANENDPDKGWRHSLHAGDEVTWTDPDGGLCSKTFVIRSIGIWDNWFSIIDTEGNCLDGFLEELS